MVVGDLDDGVLALIALHHVGDIESAVGGHGEGRVPRGHTDRRREEDRRFEGGPAVRRTVEGDALDTATDPQLVQVVVTGVEGLLDLRARG